MIIIFQQFFLQINIIVILDLFIKIQKIDFNFVNFFNNLKILNIHLKWNNHNCSYFKILEILFFIKKVDFYLYKPLNIIDK